MILIIIYIYIYINKHITTTNNNNNNDNNISNRKIVADSASWSRARVQRDQGHYQKNRVYL